ncbi:MAG TPA: glycosyltransferase [Candidatus Acidoferrum sp.]|nr:glycosyltransferase [Candidatus Acidoferrum sp.]
MKKIQVLFHDAGGGHRNAAVALQTVISQQNRGWQVELVQFQELTDHLDVLRKLTGIRIQEQYNTLLRNGWTLGATQLLRVLQTTIRIFHRPLVKLLVGFFQKSDADLLVSVIPHFNREIAEAWKRVHPEKPFVTLITDIADFPPHFWIEAAESQYVICGSEKAVEQARAIGKDDRHIFRTSGMILRPDFYAPDESDPMVLRSELGLRRDLTTGILLFGGFGSKVMLEIVERIENDKLPVQLIVVCGRNERLEEEFRRRKWSLPLHVVGFTKEVHRMMRAADFLIGKPGPGSVAEAMMRKLPVILECNAWTLPQERYNTEWVKEKRVGIVLRNFREIVGGVRQLMEVGALEEFRRNVAGLDNRAIIEVPEIFGKLLGETAQRQS